MKSGGANAYLQYKQNQLLIGTKEEVTVGMQSSTGGAGVFSSPSLFNVILLLSRDFLTCCRLLHAGCSILGKWLFTYPPPSKNIDVYHVKYLTQQKHIHTGPYQ